MDGEVGRSVCVCVGGQEQEERMEGKLWSLCKISEKC